MDEDKLSEIAATLKELLKWTRFAGMKEIKAVLMSALDSEIKTVIYHLSDGNKGSIEIANFVKISDQTVRNYWKIWAKLAIVEPIRVRGGERYKKVFDLEDFGIEIPKIVQPTAETEPKPEVEET